MLLGILLVVGVVLGSSAALAAESADAAISTVPSGHEPGCGHEAPPPDAAFTDQSRRSADPTPDGSTAVPSLPAHVSPPTACREGETSGSRGPPNAGRALLESLGISRT